MYLIGPIEARFGLQVGQFIDVRNNRNSSSEGISQIKIDSKIVLLARGTTGRVNGRIGCRVHHGIGSGAVAAFRNIHFHFVS
jgi:hypothetical protein